MTFNDAISYITDALKFGINPGLQKIEAICKELDNPQLKYPTIQITGTNGKTSTTWMTRDLLRAYGLKTGCYTSPHLHSYRERMAINGELIPEEVFAATLEDIKPAIDKVRADFGELTEFEILTAMAFYYFAKEKVDVAVFEVGLGGRWDATSMVRPKVAAVTGISLDHTDRLGNTVEEIARDKAHIIKSGSTAIVGKVPNAAIEKIKERCELAGAPTKLFGKDFSPVDVSITKNEGSALSVQGIFARYGDIKLPIFGIYQVSNFTMAVAILEMFMEQALDPSLIKEAALEFSCPGRFELISKDPPIVLDGAHNPEGVSMLVEGLPQVFDYQNLIIVLAISSDKDIEQMINILSKNTSLMVLSQNKSYRSASTNQLTDIAIRAAKGYIIEPDLEKAIGVAIAEASKSDLICITGSLYTVAEAREHCLKLIPNNINWLSS